jgi:hypothetical protein
MNGESPALAQGRYDFSGFFNDPFGIPAARKRNSLFTCSTWGSVKLYKLLLDTAHVG